MKILFSIICVIATVLTSTMIAFNNNVNDQEIHATETITTEYEEPTVNETSPSFEITEPTEEPTEPTEEPTEGIEEWAYDENLSAEENIFIYLTEYLGFSNAISCGIIANIAHETGWKFNPNAGDPSRCYGLIQWTRGRLERLKSWCLENGKEYDSIQGQLDYMYWELNYNDPFKTYQYLMACEDNIDGAYYAGWLFCYWFERPSDKEMRADRRGNTAKGYYEMLVQG